MLRPDTAHTGAGCRWCSGQGQCSALGRIQVLSVRSPLLICCLQGRIVFDDEPSRLTPSVVRDIYGADQEPNESMTSTSIPGPVFTPEPVRIRKPALA